MLTTIELRQHPDMQRLVRTAFPDYRKRRAFVSVFHPTRINSYWDGGSRDEFAIVEIATGTRKALPTTTHPYFDLAGRGIANMADQFVSVDHVGNVTLNVLPDGFALVSAGTFCGKPAMAHVYLPASNMPKYLEVGTVTAHE